MESVKMIAGELKSRALSTKNYPIINGICARLFYSRSKLATLPITQQERLDFTRCPFTYVRGYVDGPSKENEGR